jgi:hypothetical protein
MACPQKAMGVLLGQASLGTDGRNGLHFCEEQGLAVMVVNKAHIAVKASQPQTWCQGG